jgi:hypothetical protein
MNAHRQLVEVGLEILEREEPRAVDNECKDLLWRRETKEPSLCIRAGLLLPKLSIDNVREMRFVVRDEDDESNIIIKPPQAMATDEIYDPYAEWILQYFKAYASERTA